MELTCIQVVCFLTRMYGCLRAGGWSLTVFRLYGSLLGCMGVRGQVGGA